jgi:Na+-translocating ferredoxin:NAD+ oxidoreductase subunit D
VTRAALDARTAPHIHRGTTTAVIMWSVVAALLPAAAWGVFSFGLPALRTLAVAVVASLATELVIGALLGRRAATLGDGSAFVTGLLVGLTMPPSVPPFVPAVAAVFATGVAKWAFGGLGANWVNPALAGYLVAFLSWRDLMTRWTPPRLWSLPDGITAATPLGLLHGGGASRAAASSLVPAGVPGYAVSSLDHAVTAAANKVLGGAGSFPDGLVDLLVGNRPGAIGEVSVVLLLIGAAFLMARRIIAWQVPAAFIGTVAFLAWALGGRSAGLGYFHGNVALHLLGGSLLLGAFFMATDPVTSPLTRRTRIVYGIGCGCLTYLIRSLGTYPEGVAFAIVLMNMTVPLMARLTERRGRVGKGR